MKKYLFFALLLAFPFIASAQSEPALYPKLFEGIKDLRSLVLNDHVNILQANIDNETFNVAAVNDKMQVMWNTPLQGFADTIVRLKDKIVAVASTDHNAFKGSNNTYKAFVIDATNGKVLAEKVIYTDADDYMQFATVVTGNGNYLKFTIRKTAIERRLHVGIPGLATLSINKIIRQYNETKDLNVVTFDDKLNQIDSFKPAMSNGTFISITGNKRGDLFISWLNGPTIDVYKYDDGKKAPSGQLSADIVFKEDNTVVPSSVIKVLPSSSNDNIVFFGVMFFNADSKSTLGIGKFNFTSNKKDFITETFTKDHIKALEKSFTPVNKKIDDIDFGPHFLNIHEFTEKNGMLIATVSAQFERTGTYSSVWEENSTLINGYDTDLNLKFQQLLPSLYMGGPSYPVLAITTDKNKLFVVCNAKTGMLQMSALYAVLDMSTGKWDKMAYLSKKKLSNSDIINGRSVLWFSNSFILPYLDIKGLMKNKFDVTLQQNEY